MRVEWAKTHARANRWQEEMLLVTEEMRRVIAFLDWKATWWRAQGPRRTDVRDDIKDGLVAYAQRQGDLMQKLAESFAAQWYPTLAEANLSIEWPTHYLTYATAHPPTFRAPRRKRTTTTTTKGDGSNSGDESDDADTEDEDGGGYSSPEGDDVDVSPYR
jgi:hypothetical protein